MQATLTGILPDRLWGTYGIIVGVALNVLVFFVFAEAVPKTYAVLYPQKAALVTARPVSALVAFPPLRLISQVADLADERASFRGKGLQQGPFVTESELLGIVETAADDERGRARGTRADREHHRVRRHRRSRSDGAAARHRHARATRTVTAALDVAIAHGFSRLPVLAQDGDDDVVGLAYTKDLMRAERDGQGDHPVTELVRPARFIPENKPVNRLMREMQAEKFHLALVADEYGAIWPG